MSKNSSGCGWKFFVFLIAFALIVNTLSATYYILAVFLLVVLVILVIVAVAYITFWIYKLLYYKSKRFLHIKDEVITFIDECNDLNSHVENLKKAFIEMKHTDYGYATYLDHSLYNFTRPELKKIKYTKNVYQCSLSVCKNAQQQPFKYICKYFNVEVNEETLAAFEKVFNDFSAAEQGRTLLINKKTTIMESISSKIPFVIRKFDKNTLSEKLGFEEIDLTNLHFPKYSFQYVSGGGNSSMNCDIILDLDNLERFIEYLSQKIKFKKSIAGQRALMTSALREKIKARDNYTCQICAVSVFNEPHLLLEIDHIIPLARGGVTTEANLQTLCWKCNRSKGSKITE